MEPTGRIVPEKMRGKCVPPLFTCRAVSRRVALCSPSFHVSVTKSLKFWKKTGRNGLSVLRRGAKKLPRGAKKRHGDLVSLFLLSGPFFSPRKIVLYLFAFKLSAANAYGTFYSKLFGTGRPPALNLTLRLRSLFASKRWP